MPPLVGDQLTISLRDDAGNSLDLTRSIVRDNAGPSVIGIVPAHASVRRGPFTTSLTGANDISGVAKAELWANGRYVGADAVAPYSLTVRPGTYSGTVNLRWRLTDQLGNTRDHTRQVIADNRAPTVTISKAPADKAKIKGTTRVYVKASDPGGVARVELIVNGKVVARDQAAGYVLAFNASKQKKTMKVRVRAYDKLGNVEYTSTRTWYRR
ncbi:Ig-like domain-containing protein [Actinoplanes philippinensis]|uniref:Ig-like domain-containing protein n=1 Tax=Actinoplanes philippinensis TaxID=35752 RepID=UPI0033D7CEC2